MIKLLSNLFFALFLVGAAFSQNEITGVVTDSDSGSPIPGVTVQVKGTSIGAVTDFDGNYNIMGDVGEVLVFSYLGFSPKEVTISNDRIINVSLK